MSKAEELIKKYKLIPDHYYDFPAYPLDFKPYTDVMEEDANFCKYKFKALKEKYKNRVPDRWYGFDGLGNPTPYVWYEALEEFLEYVEQQCPQFEIYQIKIKFGGIRIYLGNISEEIQQDISKLTSVMTDAKLVY